MSNEKLRHYVSDDIEVIYSAQRCIHAAECVKRLSTVFDTQKRPWIQPDQAGAEQIAQTIDQCPSGALHYVRADGVAETVPTANTIQPMPNGPLYVRGNVVVLDSAGAEIVRDTRVALCRCGGSANKPFCDNSHQHNGFSGDAVSGNGATALEVSDGELVIQVTQQGSLLLKGPFQLIDAEQNAVWTGTKAALCRCGGSANKPFCDGTHKHNGFTG